MDWDPFLSSGLFHAGLGGFTLSGYNLIVDVKKPMSQRAPKDFWYWLVFLWWPAIGVVVAFMYSKSGYRIDGWLAFTLGLTTPSLLQNIIQSGAASDRPPPNAEPGP